MKAYACYECSFCGKEKEILVDIKLPLAPDEDYNFRLPGTVPEHVILHHCRNNIHTVGVMRITGFLERDDE